MFQFEITRCCTLLSLLYNNVAIIYIYIRVTCWISLAFSFCPSWQLQVEDSECGSSTAKPSRRDAGFYSPLCQGLVAYSVRICFEFCERQPQAMVSLRVEQFDKKGAPIENWVCFRSLQSRQVMASAPWPSRIGELLFLKCCRTNTYFSLWF